MIHIATLQDLAKLMGQLRERSGMSYRTLADAADIDPGTLRQLQHGQHWPRLDTLGRLLQWHKQTVTIGLDPEGKGGDGYARNTGQ